ncbi:uncharacterized protein LOC130120308 [Lampris incognitus]|uniref:uncharacterized protein LOC130120308 n=1 Tax=Lampris incognitus TaxID=2546036 RepID=UPI0024B4D08E|nr:uncharacterized protein LOC130120308 [Lampris incognitus]
MQQIVETVTVSTAKKKNETRAQQSWGKNEFNYKRYKVGFLFVREIETIQWTTRHWTDECAAKEQRAEVEHLTVNTNCSNSTLSPFRHTVLISASDFGANMCRDAEMAACSVISFIIATTTCLSLFFFQPSYAFKVNQPESQMVNAHNSSSIRCEHTADVRNIIDVRLNRVKQADRVMCCQKGMAKCSNIICYEENPNSFMFVLLNIGMENMTYTYECEISVAIGRVTKRERGLPTRLLPHQFTPQRLPAMTSNGCIENVTHGPNEPSHLSVSKAVPTTLFPPAPAFPLKWILIILLALVILYSFVIVFIYISRRRRRGEADIDSTYMDMRKAPLGTRGSSGINNLNG